MKERFLEAARVADRLAELEGDSNRRGEEMAAQYQMLRYMEEVQVAMLNQELNRQARSSLRCEERLPLRVEGDDFGRIQARIPKKVAFQLMQQRNFGWEGLTSDEGMRDVLKEFPQFAVKTVSGKSVFGFTAETQRRRGGRVNFGRGTLKLAG